ncbi:hypothetical protein BD309DRAFT_1024515 [Dichomitus squalens]|nr:hypothetical protein BD309DRAFT_1024515 [Dichomitus squalens]
MISAARAGDRGVEVSDRKGVLGGEELLVYVVNIFEVYGESSFSLMLTLILFHTVNMAKRIKPMTWRDRTNLIINREKAHVAELRSLAEEGRLKGWEKNAMPRGTVT